jgi:pimeloyl-ACP methyl ester carboxylesterase
MPKLVRGGAQISYEVCGRGPAILLTHAYGETSDMWRGQVEALSSNHTLILWDMRGHGQSDSPDNPALYSEAETLGDMVGLLDAAGAERAVIGGLSLGGYMSLAFARAHPDRVRALLIVDTGPGFKSDAPRARWNEMATGRAESLEANGFSRPSANGLANRHRSAAGLAMAARGMLTQHDARVIESLPQIGVPALVIIGADDKPFLAAADYMAAKIPGARKLVIAQAGHMVNIDQPDAFNSAVLGFVDRLTA